MLVKGATGVFFVVTLNKLEHTAELLVITASNVTVMIEIIKIIEYNLFSIFTLIMFTRSVKKLIANFISAFLLRNFI